MNYVMRLGVLATTAALLMGGCGAKSFSSELPANLDEIDAIRNDSTLSPQQKREALAELGIDPVTINGLLRDERLGNQFGGDLQSAFDKVTHDQLDQMTPDEIQAYGDATGVTSYTDEEAARIAQFFQDEGIHSRDDLQSWLDDPQNILPDGIDEQNLRGVFVDTSPNDVIADLP